MKSIGSALKIGYLGGSAVIKASLLFPHLTRHRPSVPELKISLILTCEVVSFVMKYQIAVVHTELEQTLEQVRV